MIWNAPDKVNSYHFGCKESLDERVFREFYIFILDEHPPQVVKSWLLEGGMMR